MGVQVQVGKGSAEWGVEGGAEGGSASPSASTRAMVSSLMSLKASPALVAAFLRTQPGTTSMHSLLSLTLQVFHMSDSRGQHMQANLSVTVWMV